MVSRILVQLFILAYAPALLWASTNAAAEGAQMRNKHAPSSKKKHHKHGKHGEHTQTLEVDHHGSAKKLPHKKAVRTTHSTHVQEKASAHAGGFAEVASHIRKTSSEHVGDGGGSAEPGWNTTGWAAAGHAKHHLSCEDANEEVYKRQLWVERDYAKNDADLQSWLTDFKIEVDGVDAFEGFARYQTLKACVELCESHKGAPAVPHPAGSGSHNALHTVHTPHTHHTPDSLMEEVDHCSRPKRTKNTGGKRCVAIAHSGVEGGDGYCRLFNDRLWTSALRVYLEERRKNGCLSDTPAQAPLEALEGTKCLPWKAFVFKEDPPPEPPAVVEQQVEVLQDATKKTEKTADEQSTVLSKLEGSMNNLQDRLNDISKNFVEKDGVQNTKEAVTETVPTQEAEAEEAQEAEAQEVEAKQS